LATKSLFDRKYLAISVKELTDRPIRTRAMSSNHWIRSSWGGLSLISLLLSVTGCGGRESTSGHGPADHHDPSNDMPDINEVIRSAIWSNGGFESDNIGSVPAGWTAGTNLNQGITAVTPQTLASLNLKNGGSAATTVVGGTTESQTDANMGTAGSLRFPKYGTRSALVNYTASVLGNGQNANTLKQTMTAALGDVDAADNKVHVRFAIAPVLQNPGHAYNQQPYYFVRLQNLTKGTTLYQDFNVSAQPGVPWKIATVVDEYGYPDNIYYTDWQLVDVAPGNASLAVGDQVEILVVAAGCAAGGHWGRVYVDAFGSTIPGIYTSATGPQSANAGADITYVISYKNGAGGTASGTKVAMTIPTGTTFRSVSTPGSCTTPAVGATGALTCTIGTLAAGSAGLFTVTVRLDAGASGTITNGDYSIYATGVTPILGPKVLTTVTSNVTYANVGVTKTDGVAAAGWGQALTYAVTVSNAGPSTASAVTVTDTMPAQLPAAAAARPPAAETSARPQCRSLPALSPRSRSRPISSPARAPARSSTPSARPSGAAPRIPTRPTTPRPTPTPLVSCARLP
jgi:uncharacterized repeat protein (TIGR01451 family)